MNKLKVRAKKHLGQHFLKDLNISSKIANSLSGKGYECVLEIGPGTGSLTQFLINNDKKLFLSEVDKESILFLEDKYPEIKNNILGDFLNLDLKNIFNVNFAVIGNFPYNISSQIIFKIIENRNLIPEAVGMFQKEVAERIAAKKGSKIYGILSVITQAYYEVDILFTVSENVFTPPPKVKSAVIRMKKIRNYIPDIDEKLFLNIVKAGFNQRRKTLRNSLKSLNIIERLNNNNFLDLRAEQLSVDDFIFLTKEVIKNTSNTK